MQVLTAFLTENLFDKFTLDLIGRIVLASVCGLIIGYERESTLKPAGIKTHFIVALASALMMCISMFGFKDVASFDPNARFDPSRIAASIVSGVGFLGAGSIFMKHQNVTGLTTAAGIWATAGIGMAIGAGMYAIGIVSTLLIFIVQSLSHANFYMKFISSTRVITVTVEGNNNFLGFINGVFKNLEIKKAKVALVRQDKNGYSTYFIRIYGKQSKYFTELLQQIKEYEYFVSFTLSNKKYLNG